MFMTTSLGQYQLTLFGTTSTAPATEIGADDRSVFLRPITAAGESASETWPNTVEVQPEEPGYNDWLTRMAEYRSAAGGSSSEVISYQSDAADAQTHGKGYNSGRSENAQAGTSSTANNSDASGSKGDTAGQNTGAVSGDSASAGSGSSSGTGSSGSSSSGTSSGSGGSGSGSTASSGSGTSGSRSGGSGGLLGALLG